MEKEIIFLMFSIFFIAGSVLFLSIPGSEDVQLIRLEQTIGNEGDLCRSPTLIRDCAEGLICVIVEKDFFVTGYCLDENEHPNIILD